MKLKKFYSIDECSNEDLLFEKLDQLQDDGKIEYEYEDNWSIKLVDVELTPTDEKDLINLFEKLDVYPNLDKEEADLEEESYDDFYEDEYQEDYKSRRKNSDDEYLDY